MFQKSQGDGHNGEKFVWCPKWVQKNFQEELSRKHTGTNNGKNHNLCSVDETQEYKLKLKEEEGSRAQNMGIHEEPKSEQTGTNTTSQNFDSVDETQDNKSELEEVEGSNGQNDKDRQTANEKPIFGANLHSEPLDSKHSDEHEISGSKGDDAKHINAEVAGDGVEEQHDITDHQQSAHKPTVMATDDSSITESPTKPLQSVSHNQQCSNQVDLTAMKDDTSPELTSVPQDELEGRLSLAQEDGPIGGPAIPPQKAETIEETLKQGNDDDTKANLGDLPEENFSSVLENRDVPEDAPESTGFEV